MLKHLVSFAISAPTARASFSPPPSATSAGTVLTDQIFRAWIEDGGARRNGMSEDRRGPAGDARGHRRDRKEQTPSHQIE